MTLASELATHILLFCLIFGMSATVDSENLKNQLRNKYAIIIGVAMQFIIMPLLGFLAVLFLKPHGLTMAMGISLLIVTSSPGGSYSNWWCSLFNADLALSVAMTALSTIMSVALLPANLLFYAWLAYGRDREESILESINFGKLFISIGTVIGAILAGLFASFQTNSKTFRKWSNRAGSLSGILLILFSAVFSSTQGGDEGGQNIWSQPPAFYIATIAPCVFGLVIANIIASLFANLKKPEVVTLSVECCYQNVGIATSAAVSLFDDPVEIAQALAVPLAYGLVEAVLLGVYCLVAWKLGWTKAPKNHALCTVLCISYENDDDPIFNLEPEHGVPITIGSESTDESSEVADQEIGVGDSHKFDPNYSQEDKILDGEQSPVRTRANTEATGDMSIAEDNCTGSPITSDSVSQNISDRQSNPILPRLSPVMESPRIKNRFRLPHWLKRRDSVPIGDTTDEITISPRDASNRCELAES